MKFMECNAPLFSRFALRITGKKCYGTFQESNAMPNDSIFMPLSLHEPTFHIHRESYIPVKNARTPHYRLSSIVSKPLQIEKHYRIRASRQYLHSKFESPIPYLYSLSDFSPGNIYKAVMKKDTKCSVVICNSDTTALILVRQTCVYFVN